MAIGALALGQAGANKHHRAPPIKLGFVESLVRRSGGELVLSHSEVGTMVELVLPRAADWRASSLIRQRLRIESEHASRIDAAPAA